MQQQKIIKTAAIVNIIIALVVILVYAKPFLVPVSFGALLAMLLLPVTKWLQRKGIGHAFAIILSIFFLMAFFALIVWFISWQVSDIASNTSKLEEQLANSYQKAQQYIAHELGVPVEKQQEMFKKQQSSSSGKMGSFITAFLSGLGGFLTNTMLVLVYIFLFIYFRGRLKGFVLRLVPEDQAANALETMDKAQKVAQKYLSGLALMIVLLWVMYGIGFSIAGVKNAIFFAILCGLLEIVPFVGNITGTALTVIMSMVDGGGSNVVIGILVSYALVQFIQTYILEPLVVGSEVSINPLATIVGLVAGELLWGIPGMILAIPLMGIAKVVCDHVTPLKPYAYLIGQDKKDEKESGLKTRIKQAGEKIKGWFK